MASDTALEVYTVEEVAKMLKISPMTVYRLIRQGELPVKKIGGRFRIPRAALEAYLATLEKPAPKPPKTAPAAPAYKGRI
jgi:putative molybdopterin biosynthesis protein